MKKLVFSAAASALAMLVAATSPVLAQRDNGNRDRGNQSDNNGNGRGNGNENRGNENRGNENRGRAAAGDANRQREPGIQDRRQQAQPQQQAQPAPQQQQRQFAPQIQERTGRTNLDAAAAARAREDQQRRDVNNNDRRPGFNTGGNTNNNFGRNNDFNRNNANANRWRYDPRDLAARRDAARDLQFFRRNFVSQNRFRVNVYIGPPGYSYRRWTYGQVLPRLYYSRNYWIDDFAYYGLEYPPPGYAWVRYGPDALLIDEYTGEIVEVAYNVFWW